MKNNSFSIPGRAKVAPSVEEDNARAQKQAAARKENKTPPAPEHLAALADSWGAKLKRRK